MEEVIDVLIRCVADLAVLENSIAAIAVEKVEEIILDLELSTQGE